MRRKHPKAGLDFSDDGAYMALVHRQECKDVIRIYSTETWQPLSEFFADTVDMVDLKWSPNGRMLAVWDSNLHYNVLVYSIDGRRLEHYSAYAPHQSWPFDRLLSQCASVRVTIGMMMPSASSACRGPLLGNCCRLVATTRSCGY